MEIRPLVSQCSELRKRDPIEFTARAKTSILYPAYKHTLPANTRMLIHPLCLIWRMQGPLITSVAHVVSLRYGAARISNKVSTIQIYSSLSAAESSG